MQDLITAEKKPDIPESGEPLPSIQDIERDAASDFTTPAVEDKEVKPSAVSIVDDKQPKKLDSKAKLGTLNSPRGRPSSLGIFFFSEKLR